MNNKFLLAKFSEKTGKKQTLTGHVLDCLKILKYYFENNDKVIEQFCKRWKIDKQTFMRNLFVAVYLHDIGKLTEEFQKRIQEGKHSQQWPHAFYAFPLVWEIFKKNFKEFIYGDEPVIETLSILAHHTQLYDEIYEDAEIKEVRLTKKQMMSFINEIEKVYKILGFKEFFEFKWNEIEDLNHLKLFENNPQHRILIGIRKMKEKIESMKNSNQNEVYRLKSIYTYFLSNLKLCDFYASVEFSDYAKRHESKDKVFNSVIENPEKYILSLPEIGEKEIMSGNKPYRFQEEIKIKAPKFCLLFAPCGRGKTEAALLWAFKVCEKYNRNKIIFAMPTQTTSNAMRDRFVELLNKAGFKGKEFVGLYHGKSSVKLREEILKEKEISDDELSDEDVEDIKSEDFKGNIFFKPVTITTVDHLILSFVHGFPQADFALGNLQNAVIIFDEIHYYEKQTLKHLVDLFKILRKMEIPHLLMSGTLPDFIIHRVNKDSKDENIVYELIKDKEGLKYTPFRLERFEEFLITKEKLNEELIDEIVESFKKGLNQFIILNTVERAQKVYRTLKERLQTENIFLLHSQFTYADRTKKEEEVIRILKIERKRPVVVVSTQVIEISLDISCDVMYTELAPVDALGQRGGRINRGSKYWKNDGMEFVIKVFRPENEHPYDKDILQRTDEFLKPGIYSYLTLKNICNKVYPNDFLEKFEENWSFQTNGFPLLGIYNEKGVFERTCLFGLSPSQVAFDEETGNALVIRPEKQIKVETIPQTYYNGDEKNLKTENKAKIPLWWILQDENEHGKDNLQWFEKVEKGNKIFWICKLPYNSEYGFDHSKLSEFNENDITSII